ncbi:MAG: hypothetical protein WBM14_17360 [Terracidiphilus sp.]
MSSISADAMFSSMYFVESMPGIGTIKGFCANSHARGYLRWRGIFACADRAQQFNHCHVRLHRLRLEAGKGRTQVSSRVKRCVSGDLSGEESCPEQQTDQRVLAYFSDRTPECKEFFRADENSGFLEEVLRESGSAQNRGDCDPSFLQPQPKTAGDSKVLDHGFAHDITLGALPTSRQANRANFAAESAKLV